MLLPYFVYIAHFTKFARGSSLIMEKIFAQGKIKSGRKSMVKKKREKKKKKNRPKGESKSTILSREEKKFLCESEWYWRSSTMAFRFLTKKSPSNQNLPYEMLNTGFPFLYSSNINNRPAGFFLAFGKFAHYRVFLLNAPLSDRDAMDYFSREILIHPHWRQEVPLSYWFAVSGGEIISWRGASCLWTIMS